jgi:hypothetical protein
MNRYERALLAGKVKDVMPSRVGMEITRKEDLRVGDPFIWRQYHKEFGTPEKIYCVTLLPRHQLGSLLNVTDGTRHYMDSVSVDSGRYRVVIVEAPS